jgi:pimeloyl-ACP methyl ester carboxylesterase
MIWLLIKLYFAVMIIISLLSYLLFWYEEGSRPYGSHPGVCTRAACILRGLGMSLMSLAVVTATYLLGFLPARIHAGKNKPATADNPPILFVHGLYHNASAWFAYRRWFRQAGFTNLHSFTYMSFGTNFDQVVSRLEENIAKLETNQPEHKPVLIGHSLGGLAIRAWLSRGDNEKRVAGIITLGTPHQGSKLAGLSTNTLCRSIIFRGPLIRTIEANDISPSIPCYSLSSALDNMVLPQEGLHVRNAAWIEERTPLVSHIGMLYHKPTARQVMGVLRDIVEEQVESCDVLAGVETGEKE